MVSPEEALADLATARHGATDTEAAALLQQVGPNRFPWPQGPTLGRRLVEQLVHFFGLMLWIAAGLAFVGGLPELGIAIIVVILVNGAFGFTQEYRTARTVRSRLLSHTRSSRLGDRGTRAEGPEPGDRHRREVLRRRAEREGRRADARLPKPHSQALTSTGMLSACGFFSSGRVTCTVSTPLS